MSQHSFLISQNHFNLARNGYCTSFIESATHNFEVGHTILLEESTHEGLQLTGRVLMVVVRNVGVNVRGLRKGFVIISFSLFG
jgi:hypothetical protein